MGKHYEISGYGRHIATAGIGSGKPKLISIVGTTSP